ncbi:hypothetical protein GIB67_024857 [Kingdonia uniflora]|uniref:Protein kinase domain-containing protein n=1 Tax=Kingdonia uniflora TaxID=39325 RepID=A0A7J7NYH1_9MAGN|nr:hypothetical protein GIB67_024857 [Kingdonia uniflora]
MPPLSKYAAPHNWSHTTYCPSQSFSPDAPYLCHIPVIQEDLNTKPLIMTPKVLIIKILSHPNIVNLIEVIGDLNTDHFYMALEFVEGKSICEDSGPSGSLEEKTTRKYLRDIVTGLMYLYAHIIPIPDGLGLLIDDILQHTFTSSASGNFHLQLFMFCLFLCLQLILEFFYDSRVMDVVVHAAFGKYCYLQWKKEEEGNTLYIIVQIINLRASVNSLAIPGYH